MPTSMNIRQLAKADAEAYRRIRLQGLQECPTAFSSSFAQEAAMPPEFFRDRVGGTADHWLLGAFDAADLVGVIGFVREAGEKTRHKGFIFGVYVEPTHRRQGIARALLAEAIARLERTPGLRQVRLAVSAPHTIALRLYEAFGFIRYGEEPEALCVDGALYSEHHLARRFARDKLGSGSIPPP